MLTKEILRQIQPLMAPTTRTLYNKIGKNFTKYRRPDIRIVDAIVKSLGLDDKRKIIDVGAGSGNYSYALAERGYDIIALEPSQVMSDQAISIRSNVQWLTGSAEKIPLPDNSVDGAICILSAHHFKSLGKSFKEMARICRTGPIVVFTFDPRHAKDFWFADYFPNIWEHTFEVFPPIEEVKELIADISGRNVKPIIFKLPEDLNDFFMAAGWRKPEIYLDPDIRASMSGFALAKQNEVNRGIEKLNSDLATGVWASKHEYLKRMKYFDAGYRFLVAKC